MAWGGEDEVLSSRWSAATIDWAYIHGAGGGGGGSNMIGWVGVRRGHCAYIYAPWSDFRYLDFN
jgi:hypothetical protein